jgi:hypothetical protein
LASDINEGTYTEVAREHGAGENIWMEEGLSDRRVEKNA